jgi:hypothetical protein
MLVVLQNANTNSWDTGNAWVQSWQSVRPVPAHKQKRLFDYEVEVFLDLCSFVPRRVIL